MITTGEAVSSQYADLVAGGDIFYFQWEKNLLDWFQGFHNPVLDKINLFVTSLGDAGIFWIALTLFMLICVGTRAWMNSDHKTLKTFIFAHQKQIAWASFWALVLSVFIVNIVLKRVTVRCRPAWILDPLNQMLVFQDDYSFPSGHTSASFASAVAIYRNNKKWGIPAIVLAACIAVSRLYLFIHWPTDVFVSLFIGVFCGVVGSWIAKKIQEKFGKSQEVSVD